MVDNKNKWIEIAVGHCGNRGVAIPLSNLKTYFDLNKPLFRSFYTFDENLKDHFQVRKTIKNYPFNYYLDRIIFDIDKNNNSDEVCKSNAINLVEDLLNIVGLESIRIWFSGTGYHIITPDLFGFKPSNNLPEELKYNISHYFPEVDSIYDGARLIRVGNTINEKSRRYKIPLSLTELTTMPVNEILDLAKEPRDNYKLLPFINTDSVLDIIKKEEIKVEDKKDNNLEPTAVVTCVQKMYAEGDIRGHRHHKILRIASSYYRNGIPEEATIIAMQNWSQSLDRIEVKRLVQDVYREGYRYGCFDEFMDKYCSKKCIYYLSKLNRQDKLAPATTAEEMEKHYVNTLKKNVEEDSIDLSHIFTDITVPFLLKPGELIILLGNTGIGKTAFVQNLVSNVNLKTLWLSLEVNLDLMYRRFIQIAVGKTKEQVRNHYVNDSENTWSKAIDHINCISVPTTTKAVRNQVAEAYPQIKVLVIDTIEDMIVSRYNNDSMVKMDSIIATLRDIASQYEIIVIGISHITKADSKTNIIDVHSGKHSSSIAQKADKVISVEGQPPGITRVIRSLKARDESSFKLVCDFDPRTFRFIGINN